MKQTFMRRLLFCTIAILFGFTFNFVSALEETHVFILWGNALKSENSDKVIEDIKKSFRVLDIYKISWKLENFSNNLDRLYTTPFYRDPTFCTDDFKARKLKKIGTDPFLCIVVDVENPIYEEKKTMGCGIKNVCVNVFNKKYYYRELLKDLTVHATDDLEDANINTTLLLGKSLKDFKKEHVSPWDGDIKEIGFDVIGKNGWKNMDEILYVLDCYYKNIYLAKGANVTHVYFSADSSERVKEHIRCLLNSDDFSKNLFKIKIEDRVVVCELKDDMRGNYVLTINS